MGYKRTIIAAVILLRCSGCLCQPLTLSALDWPIIVTNSPPAPLAPPIGHNEVYLLSCRGSSLITNVLAADPQGALLTYTTTKIAFGAPAVFFPQGTNSQFEINPIIANCPPPFPDDYMTVNVSNSQQGITVTNSFYIYDTNDCGVSNPFTTSNLNFFWPQIIQLGEASVFQIYSTSGACPFTNTWVNGLGGCGALQWCPVPGNTYPTVPSAGDENTMGTIEFGQLCVGENVCTRFFETNLPAPFVCTNGNFTNAQDSAGTWQLTDPQHVTTLAQFTNVLIVTINGFTGGGPFTPDTFVTNTICNLNTNTQSINISGLVTVNYPVIQAQGNWTELTMNGNVIVEVNQIGAGLLSKTFNQTFANVVAGLTNYTMSFGLYNLDHQFNGPYIVTYYITNTYPFP